MSDTMENDFLIELSKAIEAHISDPNFGVSELAREVNMSRSNLLRKVKKLTRLSASQYIRQVRIKKAMELLRQTSMNVSEVSFKVGFSSTSYFIKCFREYYGHPPGEVGKREESATTEKEPNPKKSKSHLLIGILSGLMIIVAIYFFFLRTARSPALEKSIAVLPFKNDSNDSTNIYLINGIMESTLNNLQKIRDLRVISRTSVEKYRADTKSIPEIGTELNVSYFVEGSGQKIGDEILLYIQLIEARSDRHLWSKEYNRKLGDIFKLQQEIAKDIAQEIQAVITPEEKERIEQIPTDNLEAYDVFLQGQDILNNAKNIEDMNKAIELFEEAIAMDPSFGVAYAYVAITYYYMEIFQKERQYSAQININSDKALLHDPDAPPSLIAKAFYYMGERAYDQALPYMERALEVSPNSARVINHLADFYATYQPNTSKYLQYALKGIQLDVGTSDSITTSYTYLHLSNALVQNGFMDEALKYIDKSLEYNPDNYFSPYVKTYILLAKNENLRKAQKELVRHLSKDTTRIDILQEVGKISYYLRDYETAYKYYKKFIEIREARKMDVYQHENMKIGIVLEKMGYPEQAKEYLASFRSFAENDQSIYQPLSMGAYYAWVGDNENALAELERFSTEENIQYWVILFLEKDPVMDPLLNNPKFKRLMSDIKIRFWKNHDRVKAILKNEGLI